MRPRLCLSVIVLALVACGQKPGAPDHVGSRKNASEHYNAPHVVLISIDGFRHDYVTLFKTPNLRRLAASGVRAKGLRPVFPVKTFPNHYSMATGMYPANHTLVGNWIVDPRTDQLYRITDRNAVEDPRWYAGEPIWVTAETQGMVSASFFWVGTEAPISGIQPSYWYRFDESISNTRRVNQVLEWLRMDAERRPHFITLYFDTVDSTGHNFAPDSEQVAAAVSEVDAQIGRLLDGIEKLTYGESVAVIVVSDHGMARFESDQTWYLPDLVELDPAIRTAGSKTDLVLHLDGSDTDPDLLVRDLRRAMPEVEIHRVGHLPPRLHYSGSDPRLGDIVLIPPPGWQILNQSEQDGPAWSGWTHGWDPETPQMHGVFIAAGPGIRPGSTLRTIDMVDIYPLATRLLGLRPHAKVDGSIAPFLPVLTSSANTE